ncbi:MAG: paraquat-inducible protein A [Deltaproteobacteria bacterium]|nr:MAG: paraquat-inducible protein A [Deltaproteobacteria bacterium]
MIIRRRPRKVLSFSLSGLLCLLLLVCGVSAWRTAQACDRKTRQLIGRLHATPVAKREGRHFLEVVTFGIYEGYSKEIRELRRLKGERDRLARDAQRATMGFFGCAILFLASGFWIGGKRRLIVHLLLLSTVALLLGLSTPILSIVSYKEFPLLGQVVFQYHAKGIATTIATLWRSGNLVVGGALLLFSVVIPLLKTLVMVVAAAGTRHRVVVKGVELTHTIGKWSMADVFVVALFLAFFALDEDAFTDAELQIGLYFFLGYVLFSMVAAHLLGRITLPATERLPGDRMPERSPF